MARSANRTRPIALLLGAFLCPPARAGEIPRAADPAPAAEPSARSGWPFTPLDARPPPAIDDPAQADEPADAYVVSRLEAAALEPAPEVDRRVWIRRITFDLTGLPPEPEYVEAFLRDPRPDGAARAAVADRLLASPAFGERWARRWLDVARYAETDGFAIDGERPTLWRYRDYVIRAFNEDRPYERFVREQLAGDEIDAGPEGRVAAGFLRLGPWEADNMVPEDRRQDYLNEITSAAAMVFLGLTAGCARCHDHKYDPIPSRDFYALQAFFAPVRRTETDAPLLPEELLPHVEAARRRAEGRAAALQAELSALRGRLRAKVAGAQGKPSDAVDEAALDKAIASASPAGPVTPQERAEHDRLKKELESAKKAAARFAPKACSVENPSPNEPPPVVRLLHGGVLTAPGEETPPTFLSAFGPPPAAFAERLAEVRGQSAGRRALLADWIIEVAQPLAARVAANRVWQWLIGRGIVATSTDFGRNGSGATHPALLDHLASELVRGGWRLKPLIRRIALSRTYRTARVHPCPERALRIDPENKLLWRAPPRRLEAEEIRDAVLAASGSLSTAMGGPGFFEALPEELGHSFPFFEWHPSPFSERLRRSIYMFQRRNLVWPLFEAFDAADHAEPCALRSVSVTAPQVFALFSSDFAHLHAREWARALVLGDPARRAAWVERAFLRAFARAPEPQELERALTFLEEQRRAALAGGGGAEGKAAHLEAEIAALGDLCLVLFNASEFLYLE